jgi:hypothetical protein
VRQNTISLECLSDGSIFEFDVAAFGISRAEGQYERLPALAADLVNQRVALIAATFLQAALAGKAASGTMGGDVTVASEPGKGSIFTVRLPVALEKSAAV